MEQGARPDGPSEEPPGGRGASHREGRHEGQLEGLRERKKLATRRALSDAALFLAAERGLENVRVEDVAAAAGVSPRTFNNYFSSKYEAIASRHVDRFLLAAEVLRARPAEEPLWQAVIEAALAPFQNAGPVPDPQYAAGIELMLQDPGLHSEWLKAGLAASERFAAAVAERTGTDLDRDMYPRLVAAAVLAAQQVASDRWLRADPPVALPVLLREAWNAVAAGLPDPRLRE